MSLTETGQRRLANRASTQFVEAGEPYRFKPGQSGNPNGRPRKIEKATDQAVDALEKAMGAAVELIDNEDPRIALAAAQLVIDRAMGKPKQSVDVTSGTKVSEMTAEQIHARLDAIRADAIRARAVEGTVEAGAGKDVAD